MSERRAAAPGGPGTVDGGRRPDSSMSLLVDVMTHTLDQGYADHAARQAAAPGAGDRPAPVRRRSGRVLGVLLLVGLGVGTGTAMGEVRDRAIAAADVRTRLAEQVRARSAESDRLQEQAAGLRSEVARRRDQALAADAQGSALAERVRTLELAAAVTPVTGPGVVLTVDDAPSTASGGADAPQRGGAPAEGRVLDRDLQGVVNGLWAAGAEAVAVNGVRLSARAAIRSAGEAVLVDFRPVSPPYRVEAVGRPNALETGFVDGPSGRRLQTLSSVSGIGWTLRRADHLRLPAATEPQLRSARPLQGAS